MMNGLMDLLPMTEFPAAIGLTAVKVTLIILGAAAVVSLLRAAPASTRHGVWMLALVGALLLSPLSAVLPEWRVPVTSLLTSSPADAAADPGIAALSESPAWPKPAPRHVEGASAAPLSPSPASISRLPDGRSLLSWLTIGWLVGAAAMLLYFVAGVFRAWLWARRAQPVRDKAWVALARDLQWMTGIERDVELRWHRSASTPMTWGLTRPVILLPAGAEEWSTERRRVVLLHELAHIRRLDCLSQFVVQVTCALHWFNPAVWWAASKMRAERERACDDAVLHFGTRPSSYASHLLEIARSVRSRIAVPVGAVAMARQSELEGRLVAILEPTRKRGSLNTARSILAAGVMVAVLLPLAAFTPVTHPTGVMLADESQLWVESAPKKMDSTPMDAVVAPPSTQTVAGSEQTDAVGDKDVVKRQFSVRPGGRLIIDSDLGSINVSTGSDREVRVEVEREVRGGSNATPSDLRVSFDESGNEVRVTARKSERNLRGLNARFRITVPQRFNVDLKTAGGSIQVDDLDGTVVANTAGGSLTFGRIAGDIKAHTSGGSIRLEGSSGDASLRTSGGSITIGQVVGDVNARTSGGSVTIADVRGNLVAVTSGGSIRARMSEPPRHATRLETSGGSITLDLHSRAAVSIDARTSGGRVTTDFDVPQRPRDRQSTLRAAINGGGPELTLRTSAGSIRINRIGASGDARRDRPAAPAATRLSAELSPDVSFESEAFEARMEALGERIGLWAEAFAEQSVAPIIEWVESPEFERWVEEMALSATEISLTALEEALMALDEIEVDELVFEHLDEMPASTRHKMLKRLAREHPDADVRQRARCLLEDDCR
jgi:beta-lactamase regulating signal transducer with metallopeptidase domain/DUF4097 and DUF4098 domain-containing protein YvlB